ncbi:hypothetical protein [Streptomyces sp. S.PNR 29]|uniref:SCO7613 C-terminal domain-containing membrane protein n=1 Tax=Streptomyces sp. S.PNR 29 TaxID=2973805 RepID=UPI0025B1FF9E|nr:hypothetical protein [Streptomyces sp. S.PNR 29]MDN0196161.1 hypothetical protein [Streptomyces sp. S.PNR 29]
MTHTPPPAEELRLIDAELRRLDLRRAQLLARRGRLVAALYPAPPAPAAPPRPETSAPRVQNVLLVLGGVLLAIAATAFTLVSWGHLGIAGRALVLGAVTAAALAVPVPLLRRGLRSTAESVAGLGLALTVLDAYALHEVAFPGADGTGYAAIATAVLAGLWAAYSRALPGAAALRLPLPAALAVAQLPLLLWSLAATAVPYGVTTALLVTAGCDTVLALRATGGPVRAVAAVGAYGLGACGISAAGRLSWTAAGPSAAARAAALLLLAAAIILGAAWQRQGKKLSLCLALASGLLAVAALGGVARPALPDAWTVPAHLACGIALLAAVRVGGVPETVRHGLAWASGAVQALAVLWALPVVAVTLLGPFGRVTGVWAGAPSDAREAVTVVVPWPPQAATAVPLVLVAVAAVLFLAVKDGTWRAPSGALVLTWAAAFTLPPVLQLPYVAGLLCQGATTAAALVAAAYVRRTPPARLTATVLALAGSLPLALLSLTAQTATLTVLSALTALFAASSGIKSLSPLTAPAALAYATALACATGAAAGRQPQHTALLVLAVPVAAALLALRLRGTTRVAVEVTGAVAGLVAVGLAVSDPPMLALVLALCGVITAGTAVRSDRRPAGYAATALFVLATWVRLASWDVGTPEAYTLPVTVPALLVGALRRRRDPRASSWTAYGPGLAATFVPSLAAAWTDSHWQRPLLLGATALLVTLLGARHHLGAPLVLGGAVLALDALHELAPYLVQVAGALPRWAPPALAGLLLLALGATYEQRIRDVRRWREVLGRMN